MGRSGAVVVQLAAAALVLVACAREPIDPAVIGGSTTDSASTTSATSQSTSSSSSTISTTAPTTARPADVFDTCGDFVCPGDLGPGSIECSPWTQDCPSGEKCMPWADDGGAVWNATKCTPVSPDPKGMYESCGVEENGYSGVDDCDKGLMCWDVDPETNQGHCVGQCVGSEQQPDCVDECATCYIAAEAVLTLCIPTCVPIAPDCPDANVCIPDGAGDMFICTFDASGDSGIYGDPCEYTNVCDPGLFCAEKDLVPGCQGTFGCCTEFCDLTLGDAQCSGFADGQVCTAWYQDAGVPEKLANVGACLLP